MNYTETFGILPQIQILSSKFAYNPPKRRVIQIRVPFYELTPSAIAPDKLKPY